MSNMFYGCRSLISLPDISNWNTSNVEYMDGMFSECYSLISLPDISNWNTFNTKGMNHMFYKCSSSLKLPDFYILNFNNIIFEVTYQMKEENNQDKLRILGENFINKNKFNGQIIYKNKTYRLEEYFEDIDENYNRNDIVKFLLYLDKNINDLSYLFCECESLVSVNRIYKIDNNIDNKMYEKYENFDLNNSSSNSEKDNLIINYCRGMNDSMKFDLNLTESVSEIFKNKKKFFSENENF